MLKINLNVNNNIKVAVALFFFSFLLYPISDITNINAQTLKGVITDKANAEPLPGVNVFFNHQGQVKGTTTNIDGEYTLELKEGNHLINFTFVGYEGQNQPVSAKANQTITLDIQLVPQAELMEEVVVSAGRFDQKLSEITVSMEVVKPEQIQRQNATDLSVILNTLPGVDVTDKQPSIRGGAGWTYGVGSRALVLVDGMSILTPGVGEINWNSIPMENVAQVEVIKGASSVLYGSSALNGLINVRTTRPGTEPTTAVNTYIGIYGNPKSDDMKWWGDNYWHDGKFEVTPLLRRSLLSGIRNPIYTSTDISHSRRIGNFDLSGGLDMYTNEGFRQGDYNQRARIGGNLTYHNPKVYGLNYGMNFNYLTNDFGGFFIWRSAEQAYSKSAMANMSRQSNAFYVDPFLNYSNADKSLTHKFKARYYHKSEKIFSRPSDKTIVDLFNATGFDFDRIEEFTELINSYAEIDPANIVKDLLRAGSIPNYVNAQVEKFAPFFPTARPEDIIDIASWAMARMPFPTTTGEAIPWLLNINDPKSNTNSADNTNSYYMDYQFSRRFGEANYTVGMTYEHVGVVSNVTGAHKSDNVAAFIQYDQKFFERLNLSLGMRLEYYKVDDFNKEAETNIFGWKAPFKPIFRGGLNYQLTEGTFIRASIGQGYRYPSITEKFLYKDIGGVAAFPNNALRPESGYNAEFGIKQGIKFGNLMGFVDIAGFYTAYKDMIEFNFGLFDNNTFEYINSMDKIIGMLTSGDAVMPGVGIQFTNIPNARIFGLDCSFNGMYEFTPSSKLTFSLGYVYLDPTDPDWQTKNEEEELNLDLLAMKEKSNESKYLKYRQKHSAKAVLDYQLGRWSLGTNLTLKSKTLNVDYFMIDERVKPQDDVMDMVRSVMFPGLHEYWQEHNKGYFAMDARLGVKVTKHIQCWLMCNNILNKEYSLRPMDVSAPRTFILQANAKF